MKQKSLPGVFATKKLLSDGTTRIYWYHRSAKKKLPGEYGSAEFLAAYQEANTVTAKETETVAHLIREYLLSPSFEKNLATRTKAEYRRMLSHIEIEFGTMPIKALESPKVRGPFITYQERIAAKTPREADNRMSVISAVFSVSGVCGPLNFRLHSAVLAVGPRPMSSSGSPG